MSEDLKNTAAESAGSPANGYRTIIRRMSAFGGIQMFNILINLVRGKFVAIILGPEGMGVSSLFNSSGNMIKGIGSLGLNLSVVREVSAGKGNRDTLHGILAASRRMFLLSSLFGALICIIFAPALSRWTFGSDSFTWAFVLLSAFICFTIAGSGYSSLLQGLGEVRALAKASVIGGAVGLCVGVPLFWFIGIKGIVPSMVTGALCIFLFYYHSYRKAIGKESVKFSLREHRPVVKRLVSLGLVLVLLDVIGYITAYIINLYVRYTGSIGDVGLYQAANSITQQYVGVVFSTLALDYFPRLSAVVNNTGEMRNVVNRQTEVVSLVITPLSAVLILTAPVIIRILLSSEFLGTQELMRWMGLGMLLQGISFTLNYIYLSKGDKKVYIWLEGIISPVIWITSSILFYHLFGLVGLGVGFVFRTAIDIVVSYTVNRRFYGFRYFRGTLTLLLISVTAGTGVFISSFIGGAPGYTLMSLMTVASASYSFFGLRKRLRSDKETAATEKPDAPSDNNTTSDNGTAD